MLARQGLSALRWRTASSTRRIHRKETAELFRIAHFSTLRVVNKLGGRRRRMVVECALDCCHPLVTRSAVLLRLSWAMELRSGEDGYDGVNGGSTALRSCPHRFVNTEKQKKF